MIASYFSFSCRRYDEAAYNAVTGPCAQDRCAHTYAVAIEAGTLWMQASAPPAAGAASIGATYAEAHEAPLALFYLAWLWSIVRSRVLGQSCFIFGFTGY